jgi:hypothetical protein
MQVLREGAVIAAFGIAAGLVIAWAGGRLLTALLYRVSPGSVAEYAGGMAVIAVVRSPGDAGPGSSRIQDRSSRRLAGRVEPRGRRRGVPGQKRGDGGRWVSSRATSSCAGDASTWKARHRTT